MRSAIVQSYEIQSNPINTTHHGNHQINEVHDHRNDHQHCLAHHKLLHLSCSARGYDPANRIGCNYKHRPDVGMDRHGYESGSHLTRGYSARLDLHSHWRPETPRHLLFRRGLFVLNRVREERQDDSRYRMVCLSRQRKRGQR